MRILVAGGSGVLARSVVPVLLDAGHDVTVTSRSAEKVRTLERPGVTAMVLDALDRDSTMATVARAEPDAVLHLMTDLGMGDSTSNARLRSMGTRNLVDAARGAGVDRIVAQSISWVYPSGTGSATEADPVDLGAGEPRACDSGHLTSRRKGVPTRPQHRGCGSAPREGCRWHPESGPRSGVRNWPRNGLRLPAE